MAKSMPGSGPLDYRRSTKMLSSSVLLSYVAKHLPTLVLLKYRRKSDEDVVEDIAVILSHHISTVAKRGGVLGFISGNKSRLGSTFYTEEWYITIHRRLLIDLNKISLDEFDKVCSGLSALCEVLQNLDFDSFDLSNCDFELSDILRKELELYDERSAQIASFECPCGCCDRLKDDEPRSEGLVYSDRPRRLISFADLPAVAAVVDEEDRGIRRGYIRLSTCSPPASTIPSESGAVFCLQCNFGALWCGAFDCYGPSVVMGRACVACHAVD